MNKSKTKEDKPVRERVVLKTRKGGTTILPAASPLTETKVKEAENEADKT